ncbi:MAG: FabA/FabZ family ACP-dehydratase [Planctomycetota bacterium]
MTSPLDIASERGVASGETRHGPLVALDRFDPSACRADVAEIERVNPHRHEMRLLDRVIWISDDYVESAGEHVIPAEPFWARGHFPSRPTMPGVLMVESGAQLGCYLWNIRQDVPRVAAFLRIDGVAFRAPVVPGDRLLLLSREVKCGRRRFVTDLQGLVGDQVAFEARITGMAMEEHKPA